jgi:hypothetical protein
MNNRINIRNIKTTDSYISSNQRVKASLRESQQESSLADSVKYHHAKIHRKGPDPVPLTDYQHLALFDLK